MINPKIKVASRNPIKAPRIRLILLVKGIMLKILKNLLSNQNSKATIRLTMVKTKKKAITLAKFSRPNK